MKIFHTIVLVVLLMLINTFTLKAQYLNPGDGVRIAFFNISDKISGDYYIQQDGKIQLPYAGLITTTNKPYPELKLKLLRSMIPLYINPELTVQPLYKINILGEVKLPGLLLCDRCGKINRNFCPCWRNNR